MSLYNIMPGTTPNDTISANESSCLPMSDLTFKSLAAKPSRKSATSETMSKSTPSVYRPVWMLTRAQEPQKTLSIVSPFGICCIMLVVLLYCCIVMISHN